MGSTIGRAPHTGQISGADIPENVITTTHIGNASILGEDLAANVSIDTTGDIATTGTLNAGTTTVDGFKQNSTKTLLGTYPDHEVLIADTFQLSGDVTISDNLVLSKLSDDGNAISLIPDGTGDTTITGAGSLETSTIAQTPVTTITGMTGELGSGVTGGSGLTALGTVTSGTIGSGVTGGAGLDGGAIASSAFVATKTDNNWYTGVATDAVIPFNSVTGGSCFSVGGDYDTTNSRYVVPETGLYWFSYNIYTALSDTINGFKIAVDGSQIIGSGGVRLISFNEEGPGDHNQAFSIILSLTQGQYVDVRACTVSDWYSGHSHFTGMRLT